MILTENLKYIEKYIPSLHRLLTTNGLDKVEGVEIAPDYSKNGMPNLAYIQNEKKIYFHSQYDPQNEAQIIVNQFGELERYEHVLFFGFGMGYHIEEFTKKFPQKSYCIFEPIPQILEEAASLRVLTGIKLERCTRVYLHSKQEQLESCINDFMDQIHGEVFIYIHPLYAKVFEAQTKDFAEKIKLNVFQRANNLRTTVFFEKLWALNSITNLRHVLSTPNVLLQKNNLLTDVPALLVAAGPSLQDEIENLRNIKENGLAYIFAVGSANKVLIQNNIFPDAVCSYEAVHYNHVVYEEIITQSIDCIPLIYASCIGPQTLELYPGPKYHMITSQDKLTPFLIGSEQTQRFEKITDAPSIAVLTLELLYRLGWRKIILVGQNFAFKGNQYYSKGIHYDNRPTELSTTEQMIMTETESVDGGQVYTIPAHNVSRKQMESYISVFSEAEVINTTNGGAKIEGARYIPLWELIESEFIKHAVRPLFKNTNKQCEYNLDTVIENLNLLSKHNLQFNDLIDKLVVLFNKLDKSIRSRNNKQLLKEFPKFDELIIALRQNSVYQTIIQPMSMIQFEVLQKAIPSIRDNTNPASKAKIIMEKFGRYIFDIKALHTNLEKFMGQPLEQYIESLIQSLIKEKTIP